MQQLSFDEDEVLVSFDVVSLFTRIPVPLAIEVARQRLEADDTLADRPSLAAEDVLQLLSLYLNDTYFSFRGPFYHQIFGTAMGSPVSVVCLPFSPVRHYDVSHSIRTFFTFFKY